MANMSRDEVFESVTVTEVKDLNCEIGRGSYGAVKEVSLHGAVCAAKVIHETLLTGDAQDENKPVQDYILECFKCCTLRHPNLVQFLGLYYPDKTATIPWLIMEKLDTSLSKLLDKYTEPSDIRLERKISILQDISYGIQYLHSQGIIHRDLSSNNILLTKQLVAKVADLGVAKVIDPEKVKTHTQAPGTLVFMPPEVQAPTPRYGMPVDIFSFGCVTIHLMSHQFPLPEGKGPSEIEKRWKYLREVEIIPPLIQLITDCLKDGPNERPAISKVVETLQSIVTEYSLAVCDVIELDKQLASGRVMSIGKEVGIAACNGCKSVKLTKNVFKEERSIKQSKSFSKIMENIHFPGSPLTKGSNFLSLREDQLLVHCSLKRYNTPNGLYVLSFDLKEGTLDWIKGEVQQVCSYKDNYVAMESSPGRKFYMLDASKQEWKEGSFPPLPRSQIKYPNMLVYSSLLLVISGSYLQVLELDSVRWFVFRLMIPGRVIEPSLTTYYAILDDKLFVCFAKTQELYSLNLLEIEDATLNKTPQPEKETEIHLTNMLYPANFILLHKKYLVALHIEDKSVKRAWYYSTSCNHWHNVVMFDQYIDGQWFTMEDGSAAVAELFGSWHVWYNGYYWNIGVKIHKLELTDYMQETVLP